MVNKVHGKNSLKKNLSRPPAYGLIPVLWGECITHVAPMD